MTKSNPCCQAMLEKILNYCAEEAKLQAENAKLLKAKHRESRPSHYKALALTDFRLYLEELFKEDLTHENG